MSYSSLLVCHSSSHNVKNDATRFTDKIFKDGTDLDISITFHQYIFRYKTSRRLAILTSQTADGYCTGIIPNDAVSL